MVQSRENSNTEKFRPKMVIFIQNRIFTVKSKIEWKFRFFFDDGNFEKGIHKGLLHTAHEDVSEEELEGQVDWRTEGAVSDVKDQGEFLAKMLYF